MNDLSAPDSNAPAPAGPPAEPPAQARRRWPFWLAGCAVLLAGLALLLAAPFTQRGSQLLLGLVPGLQVRDLQGSLLGGELRVGQISYSLNPTQNLVLDQLGWRGLRLEGQRLHLTELTLARIDLQGRSASTAPLQLPKALVLPYGVQIDQVRIGELLLDAIRERPVQDIRLALQLDAGTQAQHRINALQLHWDQLQATGELSLGASAPLALGAQLQLQSKPVAAAALLDAWQAELHASGALADFSLNGNLQARQQHLTLTAQLQPEAAMPLTQLSATADQLDLAALASGLPGTSLSGTLSARFDPAVSTTDNTSSPDTRQQTPLTLQIDLSNKRPARIDQQGIPLQRLQLRASSDLNQPGQGEIGTLLLDFASGNQPAGRLQGHASWALQGAAANRQLALTLDAQLDALQPARLDQRAPALLASGPLQLGLRQPWPAAASAKSASVPSRATPAAPASPVNWPPAGEFDPTLPLLSLHTELTGHAIAAELPVVRLQLQAAANPVKLLLQSLHAEAGAARLQASGRAEHPAKGSWRVVLDSQLNAFDPARWWPGPPGSAWQRGPHRLAGTLKADLTLPPDRTQPDGRRLPLPGGAARLAALQGQAHLTLQPSVLAGLPLAGELAITASHPPGQAVPPVHAGLTLRLGPESGASTLQLTGDLDSVGSQDRWLLRWDSPELAALRPWLRLTGTAAPPELSGDSHGEVSVSGRWPDLHSQGSLHSSRLQLDPAQQLLGLALQWRAGSRPDDPLDLQARIDQARSGTQRLDTATLSVQGSARAHQLQLQARLQPAMPAASANGTSSTNGPAMRPLQLQLQAHADGGWLNEPATQLHGWQGQLGEVLLRDAPALAGATPAPAALKPDPAPGSASAAASAATGVAAPISRVWLQHRGPTPIRLAQTPQALQFSVGASRVQLLDASLVLDQLDWQRLVSPAAEQLTLRARLEPLAIAPLLARWQPGFGWRGDLQLAGRIDVHASQGRMQADAELQRQGGDLVVIDPDNPERPLQRLGLSELRLALQADAGRWRLSQRIVGTSLGSLTGEQTVLTAPAALWPAADAALDGGIDLRVSELGQWGRWLPAGWRLSGQLNTQAHLSGRFGAPELSGELHGQQIAVRNLLQGINWTDVRLSVALQGETARIEEFSVKAGTGTGSVTGHGSATLGQAPRATLQLHADHFAALQRVDRRVVVSGDAELQLDPRTLRLSGQLRADEGRIDVSQRDAPSLSDDVVVLREAPVATAEGSGPPAPETPQRNTVIDLSADLGNAFELRGRGLSTHLTGALHLTNPAGKLAMRGTIATDDGTYAAYGQKLGIDRGLIIFTGTPDNPRLDIVATRPGLDGLRVGVAISGTAQSPRVRLFSDPEMGDTDKLSWLILGRASDGLGGTDLALLQRAAYALYAGEDDSPSLIQRIGLDELSVRQADGTVRDTVVSLGKQLSRRWYVGYERGLNATSGTWQLIYRIAQRFTLRAQSSAGDRALDLIWTWKWGPPPPQLPPLEPPPAPARPASSG
jgi:translocation and assembly module TamB